MVVPLLLPTALYFLYMFATRRRQLSDRTAVTRDSVPWAWLAMAGALLAAATLIVFAQFGGAPPGSVYVPARVIDGKIEPGHFE